MFMDQQTPNYRICKNCGNRNNPDSGQCPWCGAALRRPMDWFSFFGLIIILLVVIGLIVYAVWIRSPSESKIHLPVISHSVE